MLEERGCGQQVWQRGTWVLGAASPTGDSVPSEGLCFCWGRDDGRRTEVSLSFSTRLMTKSFPCSGVLTVRPLYMSNANSLIFFMMLNLICNKSTSKFIGSSQGLVSRVIKHLIISGNVNCIFNFICTPTFALAKNSLYKWD